MAIVKTLSLCVCALMVISAEFLCSAVTQPDSEDAAFVVARRAHVHEGSGELGVKIPSQIWDMFDFAASGDWVSASNVFFRIETASPGQSMPLIDILPPEIQYPVQETGAYCRLLASEDPKYVHLFADEIIKVIPPGSLFFGGTDPGRFVVTARADSSGKATGFFILTQNQLISSNYLKYVDRTFGKQIRLPGSDDINSAIQTYRNDVTRRFHHDRAFPNESKRLLPGEEVTVENGHLHITGETAAMAINGLLVEQIINMNTNRDIFLEEGLAIDALYPKMTPLGPIFRVSRHAVDSLQRQGVLKNREYWLALLERLIGCKFSNNTSTKEALDFIGKLRNSRQAVGGELDFVNDENARKTFSKLRGSIANLYAWRARHAKSALERAEMDEEARLAFMEAFVLYPGDPEIVSRFTGFLIYENRVNEAEIVAETAFKLSAQNHYIEEILKYTQTIQKAEKSSQ